MGLDVWSVAFREVTDETERAECCALATKAYPNLDTYQELTNRKIPVAVLEHSSG